jgi:hypothetical protein
MAREACDKPDERACEKHGNNWQAKRKEDDAKRDFEDENSCEEEDGKRKKSEFDNAA